MDIGSDHNPGVIRHDKNNKGEETKKRNIEVL